MSLLHRLRPPGPSKVRRNTITRGDLPAMAAVAVVAAVAATFAGCHPTGNPLGDAVLTGGVALLVTWLAATAPWWALVMAGGIAAGFGGWWLPVLCGVAAAGLALWIGDRKASLPALRCASAALSVQGLLRLHFDAFFTASALVAGGGMALLAVSGLLRRRRGVRRGFLIGAAVVAGAAVVFTAAFGASALVSSGDVETGYHNLQDGLDELDAGDPQAAAAELHQAAGQLTSAGDGLSAFWAQPAGLVPVVAQHQGALTDIIVQAAASAEAAADALDVVDYDALSLQNGRIDLRAVEILAGPLAALEQAVGELHAALADADTPWLIGPVADQLDDYQDRAADAERQATTIHAAAVTGPAMLGADGPRRYFLGFASPAEARGLVGVMGNYAILTITEGRIERTDFGRINDLRNQLAERDPFWLDASDDFHLRYLPYGAGDQSTDGEPASPGFWSNVTMTPDMPSSAAAMAQLWEATGGEPVDGVIVADPTALAGLLALTGPVTVEGLEAPLTAETVERFLLLDQYALDTPERRDLLEDVADATLDAVLNGTLPGPQVLARELGPAAAEGHLMVWSPQPDEEELMRLVGVDGRLPELDGRDGLAVVNDNAVANKIDTFLEREIDYQATYDESTGVVQGTVTITLTNTAPASGYPSYVIGSEFLEVPPGTNRTLLTVYTPLGAVGVTLDGEQQGVTRTTELGWNAYSLQLDLGPGETRVLVMDVEGVVSSDGYALVLRPQPLAHDDQVVVDVTGDADVSYAGTLTRRVVIDATGATAPR